MKARRESIAPEGLKPWLVVLVRVGYISKGVVYFAIGMLSIMAAFGMRRSTADPITVFQEVLERDFGDMMLALLGLGLIGYAAWRVGQAYYDLEREGKGFTGIVKRVAYVGSGLIYLGFSYSALQLATDRRTVDTLSARDWTTWLLAQPLGQWLVAIAGLGVLLIGMVQTYYGAKAKFCAGLDLTRMGRLERPFIIVLGRVGHLARGIIFAIIGFFLLRAAQDADPSLARGIGEAFSLLLKQPFGMTLLVGVAAGFVIYGIYMFFEAKYHRVE